MAVPGEREVIVSAIAVAIVALDFRTRAFDWLPDPVGWAGLAWAAARLQVRAAVGAALAAAVLSLSDVALPYSWVHLDPNTGEEIPSGVGPGYPAHQRWDPVSDERAVVMAAAVLIGTGALVLLVQALGTRAAAWGAARPARRFDALAWSLPLGWALPFVAVVVAALGHGDAYDPVWNWPVEIVALPGVAVLGTLVVALVAAAGHEWVTAG